MTKLGFALVVSAVLFTMGIYAIITFWLDDHRYSTAIEAETRNAEAKLANVTPVVLRPGESLNFTFKEKHLIYIKLNISRIFLDIEPEDSLDVDSLTLYGNKIRIIVPSNVTAQITNRYDGPVSLAVVATPIDHIKPPEIGLLYIAFILFIMSILICLCVGVKIVD